MSLNGYGGNIFITIFSSYINTVHLTWVITSKGKSLHASSQHSTGGGLFLALSQLTCLPTTQLSITDTFIDSNFAVMGGGPIDSSYMMIVAIIVYRWHFIIHNQNQEPMKAKGEHSNSNSSLNEGKQPLY